jgi:hypothetical protein
MSNETQSTQHQDTVISEPTLENSKEIIPIKEPEFIGNSPLPDTKLVYSVPVKNSEWHSGHFLRLLQSMLSQRLGSNRSLELQCVINIGSSIDSLVHTDRRSERFGEPEFVAGDDITLDFSDRNKSEYREHATQDWQEAQEMIAFLNAVIEVQRIGREMFSIQFQSKQWMKLRENLRAVIIPFTNPIQREILFKAYGKSESISITGIDTSSSMLAVTPLGARNIGALRTLGADTITARFKDLNPNLVMSLYDTDTIPESNTTINEMISIYEKNPELTYVFAPLNYQPAGTNKELVSDSPAFATSHLNYNLAAPFGSPQISCRMSAYEKIQEIANFKGTGSPGDEDRSFSYLLIYHYGKIQDALLLEQEGFLTPGSLTSDREGYVDGSDRLGRLAKNGIRPVLSELPTAMYALYRDKEMLSSLTPEQQEGAKVMMEKARAHYIKRERLQIRFNRKVIKTIIEAYEAGEIVMENGTAVSANYDAILKRPAGVAAAHYLEPNAHVFRDIQAEDIEYLKYLIGLRTDIPNTLTTLTPFQAAMREYLGEYVPLDHLFSEAEQKQLAADLLSHEVHFQEERSVPDKTSLLHSTVVEMIAFGQVYQKYLNTNVFIEGRKFYSGGHWPENSDDQLRELSYGQQTDRIPWIKEKVLRLDNKPQSTFEKVLTAFPLVKLWKQIRAK